DPFAVTHLFDREPRMMRHLGQRSFEKIPGKPEVDEPRARNLRPLAHAAKIGLLENLGGELSRVPPELFGKRESAIGLYVRMVRRPEDRVRAGEHRGEGVVKARTKNGVDVHDQCSHAWSRQRSTRCR